MTDRPTKVKARLGAFHKRSRALVVLTPYSADFSRVKTFPVWEYHARRFADLRRSGSWWCADAALYIETAFGFSPVTGRLVYIAHLTPDEQLTYKRVEYKQIAVWMGLAAQTLYNYMKTARVFPPHERDFLAGLKVSISDIDVTLRKGLSRQQSITLAHEYADALRAGGYGLESGQTSAIITPDRDELAARAKAQALLDADLPPAVNDQKLKLHRHKQWRTITVAKARQVMALLEIPPDALPPTDVVVNPVTGEITDRLISTEYIWSWYE